MDNKYSWAVAQSNMVLKGFNVKESHILFINPKTAQVVAVSTGWTCNEHLCIYELREDGVYNVKTSEGTTQSLYNWYHVDDESPYPVTEVLDFLENEEECEDFGEDGE
jgi:hypothetical protein